MALVLDALPPLHRPDEEHAIGGFFPQDPAPGDTEEARKRAAAEFAKRLNKELPQATRGPVRFDGGLQLPASAAAGSIANCLDAYGNAQWSTATALGLKLQSVNNAFTGIPQVFNAPFGGADQQLFYIQDTDTSNVVALAIALPSGVAYVITFPDPGANDSVAYLALAQALTNKTIGVSNTLTAKDSTFTVVDDGDNTKKLAFQCSGITTATTRTLTPPNFDGTIATIATAQTLSDKTLDTSNILQVTSSGTGAHFADSTTATKKLYIQTSGGSGNNLFDIKGAGRSYEFPNISGVMLERIGQVDLTGQTASLGPTNMTAPTFASVYPIWVYAKCTTAGNAGDLLSVSIGWTDGTAQSKTVIAALDLSTLNAYGEGQVITYIASATAPTYTTVVTKTGTPQYMLRIRQVVT